MTPTYRSTLDGKPCAKFYMVNGKAVTKAEYKAAPKPQTFRIPPKPQA